MKCQYCDNDEASVAVKQVVDGVVHDVQLCSACAKKHGFQSPLSIADFLFAAGGEKRAAGATGKRESCPACHMTWGDFEKSQRLGCGECYAAFKNPLLSIIDEMHRAVEHVGHCPTSERLRREAAALRRKLSEAVQRQAFEEAAALRDQIRDIEDKLPGVAHG